MTATILFLYDQDGEVNTGAGLLKVNWEVTNYMRVSHTKLKQDYTPHASQQYHPALKNRHAYKTPATGTMLRVSHNRRGYQRPST